MTDEQFTPEEQDLIRRLREEIEPQIDPAARHAIRERMIAEFRTLIAQPPAPEPRPLFRPAPVLAAAAALVLAAVVVAQITRQPTQTSETLTPQTQIVVVLSDTAQPGVTPESPTRTPKPATPTRTPTLVPPTVTVVPLPSATNTPTITVTQEMAIIVEGPISAIHDNVLTVYDLSVEVAPGHPILSLLEVGDFVRVEGVYESGGVVIADVVSNMDEIMVVDSETATVNLEGPVESINDNKIVVNGIPVELDPDDPILDSLQIGNFVSIQGNFERSGAAVVLVVVNVQVITDVEVIQSDCWYHDTGMGMGHWHCDGMGMGMGSAMGMGGMGMGN
jgi:hypothetical protein